MPGSPYDVFILAGHGQDSSTVEASTDRQNKALATIHGRPMVSYVIQALEESRCMKRLAIVGLEAADLGDLVTDCPVIFLPNQTNIIDNALSALQALDSQGAVLSVSSDVPLLSGQAVKDFVMRCEASGADLCYPIVEKQVMEARFPQSGRSFRPLADGAFAGGDLMFFQASVPQRNLPLFRALTAQRKSAWGLVKLLGPEILLRFALKKLRLRDVERRASQLLHCSVEAIISPYAELAMDVDTPQQLALVQQSMAPGQ